MADLIKEGKTRYISLSECSAESLRRGSAVHSLASLQMEYSIFSRDAETQGQIAACRKLTMAMMAYAVLGRGMLTGTVPRLEQMETDDIRKRLPRFHGGNVEANLELRSILEGIAGRKGITLAQLAIAWPIAQGEREGTTVIAIPGAKSRKHLQENVAATDVTLTPEDLDSQVARLSDFAETIT
jgi:aryl-alcohol dehydrogenase-like predicted oxidoreductase